jgi:hypothetical protein
MTTPSHDIYQKRTALNITLPPMAIPAAAWINPPLDQRKPTDTEQPCTVNL